MAGITGSSPGFLDSLRGIIRTGLSLIKTRLEIIAVELQEQKQYILQLLLLAVIGVVIGILFLCIFTFAVIAVFWDTNARLIVVGGFCVLYGLGSVACFSLLRYRLRTGPRMFETTISEIKKDLHSE